MFNISLINVVSRVRNWIFPAEKKSKELDEFENIIYYYYIININIKISINII